MAAIPMFLLTRQWRDTRNGVELEFWGASPEGPVRVVSGGHEAVCFVERSSPTPPGARRASPDLRTLAGRDADALYFPTQAALISARDWTRAQGGRAHESDIKPVDRFLMERFIRGTCRVEGEAIRKPGYIEFRNPAMTSSDHVPELRAVSIDIETEGVTGTLYSIAGAMGEHERVFMGGEGVDTGIVRYYPDERSLIAAFLEWIAGIDPDVVLGWNVINFDLMFLARKCAELRLPFALGRNRGGLELLHPATSRQARTARMTGRAVLDGIDLLRSAAMPFEQFSLEYVARELLGRGKAIHDPGNRLAEIQRLYREDKASLAAYNLEDCRLVNGIVEKAGLLSFAVARSKLTGLAVDRQGGSVAAFDFQYLPRLHRAGHVARDVDDADDPAGSPGGYVMDSQPGLFDNVLVFDFKSLYPSIIRTFFIDPLGMAFPGEDPVPGRGGAKFSRTNHILPGLIASLSAARETAKAERNAPLSYAIKILMNSFYGVLGTPGCRFHHPDLPASITTRGHEIILRSRKIIEDDGKTVIYGDTDSLFVLLGPGPSEPECRETGADLARRLNAWWRETLRRELELESHLELQFETHYLRFLMPTIRGSELGTKKRYAGCVRTASGGIELVFRGLESVRTDWTPLAREFQRELYRRVFLGEPFEDYILQVVAGVLEGRRDADLIYRKRIRRPLADYTKNVPPHIQAARKLKGPGRWISYAITVNGPEPAEALHSRIDYEHYVARQLAPIADAILQFVGGSFAGLTERQLRMF